MHTQRFNRGAALAFLFILLVALFSVYQIHQQIAGSYQAKTRVWSDYSLDDWLTVLRLDEILGEPVATPIPVEQLLGG